MWGCCTGVVSQWHHAAPWGWRNQYVEEGRGGRIPENQSSSPDDAGPWFLPHSIFKRIHSCSYLHLHTAAFPEACPPCPLSWALRRHFDFPMEYFFEKSHCYLGIDHRADPKVALYPKCSILIILSFVEYSFCSFIQVWKCGVLALLDLPLLPDYL